MEYATKRYRSNCINWGMAPLLTATPEDYALGDWVFVPGIREAILSGRQAFDAYVVKADGSVKKTSVSTGALTEDDAANLPPLPADASSAPAETVAAAEAPDSVSAEAPSPSEPPVADSATTPSTPEATDPAPAPRQD